MKWIDRIKINNDDNKMSIQRGFHCIWISEAKNAIQLGIFKYDMIEFYENASKLSNRT